MKGTLYGVGVGPGDPELMTFKAVRIIKMCDAVVVPESGSTDQIAFEIAKEHLEGKAVISTNMPMTHDEEQLAKAREESANLICEKLDSGMNIAFLTIGDPTIYSTYGYVHKIVVKRGYDAEIIPGIPSFCAASAALGQMLCEDKEPLHILPASYKRTGAALDMEGTKVIMKAGKKLDKMLSTLKEKDLLKRSGMVSRVGMQGERLVKDLSFYNEESGYFSLIIVKGEIK